MGVHFVCQLPIVLSFFYQRAIGHASQPEPG